MLVIEGNAEDLIFRRKHVSLFMLKIIYNTFEKNTVSSLWC